MRIRHQLVWGLIWGLALSCLPAWPAWAQYDLSGAVDLHAHSDPDSVPRSIDAMELAEIARGRGLRGLLLKNHWHPTAALAYVVRRQVPQLEVFGGIALNRAAGGINPEAVERMAAMRGGYGRAVWLPTFDAASIPLVRSGALLPEVKQVLELVARHRLLLCTGHYPPEVILQVIGAARAAGVQHILVTHAMKQPISMNVEQQKQAAALGAFIEYDYGGTLPSPLSPGQAVIPVDDYARAIRAVGPRHCVLSSDLGQRGNPIHTDGLAALAEALLKRGFSTAEIDLMMKTNPARLLGLEPRAVSKP